MSRYSTEGYKKNSPDRFNAFNIIPSGDITMIGVPHPVYGMDNLGNRKIMMPGQDYNFPGHTVYEIPLKNNNMKKPVQKLMQKGGAASGHAGKFWDGNKWISSSNGATYDNGTFFANGGPTFPVAGAGPLFMTGGATQVHPFAMNPGPGTDTGMLQEYANETMQMGGSAQVRPFAMAPGPGYGSGMLEEYENEQMKAGGIHIKKENRGKFTEYKKRTGKTTEEALHSPDPHVRQMANFARNAKKWHHEYGGPTMQDGGATQGGNVIYDTQGNVFAYGGKVNPYHPLARFMKGGMYQQGGVTSDDPIGGGTNLPANSDGTQNAWTSNQSNYDPGADPNNPVNNPPPMPEQGGYEAAQGPAYEGNMDEQQPQNDQQQAPQQQGNGQSGWNKFSNTASIVLTGLGAAAGVAAAYSDRAEQKRMAAYNRSLGMSDHIPVVNQPGGKGDYTQYGNFRPDSMTPARAGNFYPRQQFGGAYAFGGNYATGGFAHGQELELTDAEIAQMKKMGYKFEEL